MTSITTVFVRGELQRTVWIPVVQHSSLYSRAFVIHLVTEISIVCSPDEQVVSDKFHLLGVKDVVQSAGNASFRQLSQSDANHHILESP